MTPTDLPVALGACRLAARIPAPEQVRAAGIVLAVLGLVPYAGRLDPLPTAPGVPAGTEGRTMSLAIQPPPWDEAALCGQTDPDAFFPDVGGSSRAAKKVCRGCLVRAECLEYALAHGERFGIWGGASERERHRMLKARAA